MNVSDRFNLAELERSDAIPDRYEMPGNRHLLEASWGDVMRAALGVQSKAEADVELLMIVATHLHLAGGVVSWRQAFEAARQSIAWYAFACDGARGFYAGETDAETNHTSLRWRRENTAMRDIAFEYYGAKLGLSVKPQGDGPARAMAAIARRIANKPARAKAKVQESLF